MIKCTSCLIILLYVDLLIDPEIASKNWIYCEDGMISQSYIYKNLIMEYTYN